MVEYDVYNMLNDLDIMNVASVRKYRQDLCNQEADFLFAEGDALMRWI